MRKGQIAAFMILVMCVLFLAAVATMVIGSVAFQRIRLANVTDAALLSAATAFCRNLNALHAVRAWMDLNFDACRLGLLVGDTFSGFWSSYAAAIAYTEVFIQQNEQLYGEAKKVTTTAAKGIRQELFHRVLMSDLIDEPKPFIEKADPNDPENEVTRDPLTRRISRLDYEKYLQRLSYFDAQYFNLQKTNPDPESLLEGHPPVASPAWYENEFFQYAFDPQFPDKNNNRVIDPDEEHPGKLIYPNMPGYPDVVDSILNDYESYLKVEFTPQDIVKINLKKKTKWVFFLWEAGSFGIVLMPGCYWFRCKTIDIKFDGPNRFGLKVAKKVSLKHFPFFGSQGRSAELKHQNAVEIKGSIKQTFWPVLVE